MWGFIRHARISEPQASEFWERMDAALGRTYAHEHIVINPSYVVQLFPEPVSDRPPSPARAAGAGAG